MAAAVVVMCACVGGERHVATKKEKVGQQHFLSIAPLTLPDPAPDEAMWLIIRACKRDQSKKEHLKTERWRGRKAETATGARGGTQTEI